ncbi:MAG TPA: hypothetical protein VEQ59_09140 [Polyangiaceae bacterium]|nr:hypothetical protein [Polyangiaceae bacterium]
MRLMNSFRLAAFAAVTIFSSGALAQAPAASAKPATAASAAPAKAPSTAPSAAAPTATPTAATPTAATPTAATPTSATAATPAASAKPAPPPTPPATTTTATTAAPAAPAAATAGAEASGALDGATYVVRLRDLEQRIDELKEQIRRSHTRLSLLSDTILSGGVGGARAEITFKNDLSSAFRVTGATFVLDGAVQYNKTDESENSALAAQKEIPVFSGSIPPGDHTLQIVLRLRGHGYGVFSYLRGYKFQVPSSHTFTITEGKTLKLDVVAWEKGDVTTALEQRPSIRYVENLRAGVSGDGAGTAAPAKAEAGGSVSVGAGAK